MPAIATNEFTPGQVINFCGDFYVVQQNYGSSGVVRELASTTVNTNFHWVFQGEACRLATREELSPLAAKGVQDAIQGLELLAVNSFPA